MADQQSIIDQIRAFVGAADQTNSPHLAGLATEYAAQCNEVNARLRKCIDYIRRGLRSEAIHLAEEHPVLLEQVAALDLPEAQDWAGLCAMYDLIRPPPLLMESARKLNEAYAIEQPMQTLLSRHRRLALEQAPLTERIVLLRELAKADASSPVWEEDVRTFETARLKELKAEATVAIKTKDGPTLSRLLAELNVPGWRVEMPANVRTSIQNYDTAFTQEAALSRIRGLLPELGSAHGAMDVRQTAALVKQIDELIAQHKLALPPEIADQLGPAKQWITMQRTRAAARARIDAAVSELDRTIQAGRSATELLEMKAAVLALGGAIPEELDERIRTVTDREAASAHRAVKHRRMLTGVGIVAAMVITFFAVHFYLRERKGDEVAARLQGVLARGDISGARTELDKLEIEPEFVKSRKDVHASEQRLNAMLEQDVSSHAEFIKAHDAAISQMNVAADSGAEAGKEWRDAEDQVATAVHLAKSQSDIDAGKKLNLSLKELRRNAIDKKFNRVREELDNLKVFVASRNPSTAKLPPNDPFFADAIHRAEKLQSDASDLEPTNLLVKDIESVAQRLRESQIEASRANEERIELANVKASFSSAGKLADALKSFADKFSETDRGKRFGRTVEAANAWNAVDQVERLVGSWKGEFRPDPSFNLNRVEEIEKYASKFPGSYYAPFLTDYANYLREAQAGAGANPSWDAFIHDLEADPVYSPELRYLRATSGKVYYFAESQPSTISGQPNGWFFRYITKPDLKDDVVEKNLKIGEYSGEPAIAPQSELLTQLGQIVDSNRRDSVMTGFRIVDAVARAKNVDAVCRVNVLSSAFKMSQHLPWGYGEAWNAFAAEVQKQKSFDVAWMNPDNRGADEARTRAEKTVEQWSPKLSAELSEVCARFDHIVNELNSRVIARGILIRTDPEWDVMFDADASKLRTGASAFVMTVDNKWKKIGTFDGRLCKLNVRALSDNLDGAMVFVRMEPTPAKTGKQAGATSGTASGKKSK